jgi:hypothetical protein
LPIALPHLRHLLATLIAWVISGSGTPAPAATIYPTEPTWTALQLEGDCVLSHNLGCDFGAASFDSTVQDDAATFDINDFPDPFRSLLDRLSAIWYSHSIPPGMGGSNAPTPTSGFTCGLLYQFEVLPPSLSAGRVSLDDVKIPPDAFLSALFHPPRIAS